MQLFALALLGAASAIDLSSSDCSGHVLSGDMEYEFATNLEKHQGRHRAGFQLDESKCLMSEMSGTVTVVFPSGATKETTYAQSATGTGMAMNLWSSELEHESGHYTAVFNDGASDWHTEEYDIASPSLSQCTFEPSYMWTASESSEAGLVNLNLDMYYTSSGCDSGEHEFRLIPNNFDHVNVSGF